MSKTTVSSTSFLHSISPLGLLICIVGLLYYCFAYLLRVYPSVMEPQLLQHFQITAGGFGVLTSSYYFAYAPMQLPVGVSVDKIGPRRSLLVASIIALSGVYLFAHSANYNIALMGRFLVGFGASFAYVTALKLASVWLPQRYFAAATGTVTGGGMVAAILTDLYLTRIVQTSGLHYTLNLPIFVGLLLLLLILLIVRDRPKQKPGVSSLDIPTQEGSAISYRQLMHYLSIIVKTPQMWLIGIIGALLYLPASVFLDTWAIPYLEDVRRLVPTDAALGVSVMLGGWICSSFAAGVLSDFFDTRKIPLLVAAIGATILSTLVLYVPNLPREGLYILLFIFGVCCGPHPLCFALSKENQPQKISGTAVAFANFAIMMGGFIFQPIVGKILDWVWHGGTMLNGIRSYTAADYAIALSILPIGLLCATILAFMIKDTSPRNNK